jgi:hypothetical protein
LNHPFPEDFFQYCWQHLLFDPKDLVTTRGQSLVLLDRGRLNRDSGPDFFNALIRLDDQTWAGDVELHLDSRDWFRHGHDSDPAYASVVLHVVYEQTIPVELEGIPCLNLWGRIPTSRQMEFSELMRSKSWIPCERQFKLDRIQWELWSQRLLISRLENRSKQIAEMVLRNQGDWEEVFFQLLFRRMGFKVNQLPMEWLASKLRYRQLKRHADHLDQLEAILFGTAGMLSEAKDSRQRMLKKEYQVLKRKFGLEPMDRTAWKWSKMRPSNFPEIRLAQLAALFFRRPHLFHDVLYAQSARELEELFRVNTSEYWARHWRFGKESETHSTGLGKSSIHSLLINLVIPFRFTFYRARGLNDSSVLDLLNELPPESNSTLKKWSSLGMDSRSAAQSQALLELKHQWCDHKKCLNCQIGAGILRR